MGKGVGWTVSSSDLWAPRRWKSPLTVRRPAPDVSFRALCLAARPSFCLGVLCGAGQSGSTASTRPRFEIAMR
jgi:hypothetical protein